MEYGGSRGIAVHILTSETGRGEFEIYSRRQRPCYTPDGRLGGLRTGINTIEE
jgi:hypothetical protein